ncbi:MAG: TIGR01212 family radical SAM protein [Candidatus Omnitrophota bacterium]
MSRYYYSFSEYLSEKFNTKVRRIGLNAHFSCPNRDGKLDTAGCIFCNETGFTEFARTKLSVEEQIEKSMQFYRKRFKAEKFIAYFQNATNTHSTTERLKETYDIVKRFPDIVGLYISTRPDCVDEEKLELIAGYKKNYDVWIEYGLQSIHDTTLEAINRSHTHAQSAEAIKKTAEKGIKVGVHIILGLPGESKKDMMETASQVAALPIDGIKLHVFHVFKDTELERLHKKGKVKLLKSAEYVDLACDLLERQRPECVVMRLLSDAKESALIAPKWINRKQKIIEEIKKEFERRGTRQGSRYE